MNEQQWNGAFSAIRAEASLKEETLAYLARRTHGYRRAPVRRQLGAALAACLVVVSLVGGGLFFTPAYALSLELPAESASGTDTAAWELEVNCFHRIVSCTSTSEDSAVLSDTASLRFQDWRELLQALLTEDTAEPVSVTVISGDPDQSADVLEDLQTWTAQRPGLHCGSLTSQEAQEAQSVGLSCWKYKIYLKAKSLPRFNARSCKGNGHAGTPGTAGPGYRGNPPRQWRSELRAGVLWKSSPARMGIIKIHLVTAKRPCLFGRGALCV